jgi:hypothetical protein
MPENLRRNLNLHLSENHSNGKNQVFDINRQFSNKSYVKTQKNSTLFQIKSNIITLLNFEERGYRLWQTLI